MRRNLDIDINFAGAPRYTNGDIKVFQDRRRPAVCLVCQQTFIPGPNDPVSASYIAHSRLRGICMRHSFGELSRKAMDYASSTCGKNGIACYNSLCDAARWIREGL